MPHETEIVTLRERRFAELSSALLSRVYGISIAVLREADGSVFAFAVAPARSELSQSE
jgi:hypothetical protein